MADATKQGILSRLFGGKKSCCCNVTIEEVTEEPSKEKESVGTDQNSPKAAIEEQPQNSESNPRNRRSSSCCG